MFLATLHSSFTILITFYVEPLRGSFQKIILLIPGFHPGLQTCRSYGAIWECSIVE